MRHHWRSLACVADRDGAPHQIFVPPPHNKALLSRRRGDRPQEQEDKEPRYAVAVSWGHDYEPWVRGVRLLPATDAGTSFHQ